MPARTLRLIERWERLAGADPGRLRLRFAARMATITTLSMLGLIALNWWTGLPVGGVALGFLVAQFNGGAVRDGTRQAQAFTTLLLALPATACITLAAVLSPWPMLIEAMLLVLVVAAMLARALGPRGAGAGMLGFISFYIGQALGAAPAELPFDYAAIAYATLVALFVRVVLLPDDPASALIRCVRSVRTQTALMLRLIRIHAAHARHSPGWRRRFVHRTLRLEEAILTAQDQNNLLHHTSSSAPTRLSLILFDLDLAAERLATVCTDGTDPGRARAARPRLGHAITSLPRTTPDILDAARTLIATPESPPAAKPAASFRSSPTVRGAAQAGIASAIALVLGHLISDRRWYWSVLAAFIVFAGTMPAAVVVTKGLQRMLGTILGVGAAIALAPLIGRNHVVILALALLSDAFAFYAFQTAYSAMMFFITLALSFLYILLGEFHPELLAIRLDETILGVAAGIIVALTVLPQSTSEALRQAGLHFLRTLRTAVTMPTPAEPVQLLSAAHNVRSAAGPLSRGWVAATPLPMREAVRSALACVFWCRELPHDESVRRVLLPDVDAVISSIEHRTPGPPAPGPQQPESATGQLRAAIRLFAHALEQATGKSAFRRPRRGWRL